MALVVAVLCVSFALVRCRACCQPDQELMSSSFSLEMFILSHVASPDLRQKPVEPLSCRMLRVRAGLRPRPACAQMAFDKGITLYTAGTPNGWKANMIVEELKVPYKLHAIKLSDNEQKQEWFEKINPNGRIPAIGESLNISSFVAV